MRADHVPSAPPPQGSRALREYPADINSGIVPNWTVVQSDTLALDDRVMLANRVEVIEVELNLYRQKADELETKLRQQSTQVATALNKLHKRLSTALERR
jgi:hypothetical protein